LGQRIRWLSTAHRRQLAHPARSGHPVFAVVGTVTMLAVHLLGRPLGLLIDHDDPAEEHEDLRPYELQITCKPKSEPRIRALIVQDTSKSDVTLTGIDTTRTDDGTETRLTAYLLLSGDVAERLEQLVARLSLEPGIRTVHWRSTDEPDLAPALALSGEGSAPPDEE
jgi:putative Mg2+ transporter-C (MgtC) family protein